MPCPSRRTNPRGTNGPARCRLSMNGTLQPLGMNDVAYATAGGSYSRGIITELKRDVCSKHASLMGDLGPTGCSLSIVEYGRREMPFV